MERKESSKDMVIRFSILVPVYNSEKYLDACIRSVLDQTVPYYELILVNDGSKDGSGAICDAYAKEYEGIKAYHKENRGQLHTRQYAIGKASGEYYIFLDSDDTLQPNALEILDKKIRQHDCDCVIFQMQRVCNGKALHAVAYERDFCIEDKAELYRKCFFSTDYNSLCRKAVKGSLLSATKEYAEFYHVRFAEDLLQSLEVFQNTRKTLFISDVLYNYTVNPSSVTQSQNAGNYKIDFSVRKYVAEFLEKESVWTQEDFLGFKGYCAWLYCSELFRICSFNTDREHKKRFLEQLRQTPYFREFLNVGQYDKKRLGGRIILYHMLKQGWDDLLLASLSFYRKLKRL